MSERKCIYAIQEHRHFWELTGIAFVDKAQADTYVDLMTIRSLVEGHNFPIIEAALSKFSAMKIEDIRKMSKADAVNLLGQLKSEDLNFLAGEVRTGGIFSYEVLGIYDGENPG